MTVNSSMRVQASVWREFICIPPGLWRVSLVFTILSLRCCRVVCPHARFVNSGERTRLRDRGAFPGKHVLARRQNQHARARALPNPITSILPFAPEMGIVRNRNCPACKSLRKFGANLVGLRWFLDTGSAANRFRKGE